MKLMNTDRTSEHAIDVAVGLAVRHRRILLGMSQEAVANEIGITFQQLQKEEKGANRIPAGRLYRLAEILHCRVGDFFPAADNAVVEIKEPTGRDLSLSIAMSQALAALRADQRAALLKIARVMAPPTIDAIAQAAE